MNIAKSANQTSSERILCAALELRASPLPVHHPPSRYAKFGRIYLVGFRAGFRGWQLEQYFRFSTGRSDRREALDAGYFAGQAVLVNLVKTKLCSKAGGSLNWPITGADWPNFEAPASLSYSARLTEMDLRRAPLPNARTPRKYVETQLEASFDIGFEAGYRGWQRQLNGYRRSDYRNAWDAGHDAGDAALQERLDEKTRSAEYACGFRSGYLATRRANRSKEREGGIWNTAYQEGRRLSAIRQAA
jgi:hypothetical protein